MEKIQKLVANPSSVTVFDLPFLRDKVEKYPYVETYQLLYLIALDKGNDSNFKSELKHRSVYFSNPNFIRSYFQPTEQKVIIPTSSPAILESNNKEHEAPQEAESSRNIEEVKQSQPLQNTVDKESVETAKPSTHFMEEDYSDSYIENMRKLGLDHLIPADYVPSSNISEQKVETVDNALDDDAIEEKEVIEEVIEDTIEETTETEVVEIQEDTVFTIDDENSEEAMVSETEEEALETIMKTPIVEKQEETDIDKIDSGATIETTIEEAGEEMTSEKSEEKIQLIEEELAPKSTLEQIGGIENSIVFKNKRTFSQWANLASQKSRPIASVDQKSKVIDQFIQKNPSITPVKQANDSIDFNALMEDEQEISHLMTETLAQLYVDQKKYNKAINAYEILILKNPEKSSIFADRIKELKNKK